MENLSKDILYIITRDMNIKDVIHFCQTHKRANRKIYINEYFWIYRLNIEFPDYKNFNLDKSFLNIYIFLYQLKIFKMKLNIKETIYELFMLQNLNLCYMIIKVPKEIRNLYNLKVIRLNDLHQHKDNHRNACLKVRCSTPLH